MSRIALCNAVSYTPKLRARSNANVFSRHNRQSGSGAPACSATIAGNGRPQHWQSGSRIGTNDAKHSGQIGIRLAFRTGLSQSRHGAGAKTDASASSAERINTPRLYNRRVTCAKCSGAQGHSKAHNSKRCVEKRQARVLLNRGLQQPLFFFLLAVDAVARPGHSFQPLLLQFFVAGVALAKRAFLDARQCVVHQLEH
jgi:hypothetical protein